MKSAASLEVVPGAVITGRFVTSIRGSGFKADEAVLLVLEKAVKGEDFVFAGATANEGGAFTVTGAGGNSARGMAVAAIPLGPYTLKAIGTAGTVATTPLEVVAVPKATPIPAPAAHLRVDPLAVVSGRWVNAISGSGFKADETVLVVLEKAVKGEDFIFAGAIANKQGAFYITGAGGNSARGMAVAAIPPGTYVVKATGTAGTVAAAPLQILPAPTPTPAPTPKVPKP
ncbi:MAG: hypothetical protein Q8O76_15805 [Chloroflexota bacterium]|nr:hypothetical protein [Chloroflexota bacterium]